MPFYLKTKDLFNRIRRRHEETDKLSGISRVYGYPGSRSIICSGISS